MIDQELARIEVQNGLSFVCAHCERYWRGKFGGFESCCATGACGSPLAGDSFSHYEGPIEAVLGKICFVCGETANKTLVEKIGGRPIGICLRHLEWIKTLTPSLLQHLPMEKRVEIGIVGK